MHDVIAKSIKSLKGQEVTAEGVQSCQCLPGLSLCLQHQQNQELCGTSAHVSGYSTRWPAARFSEAVKGQHLPLRVRQQGAKLLQLSCWPRASPWQAAVGWPMSWETLWVRSPNSQPVSGPKDFGILLKCEGLMERGHKVCWSQWFLTCAK